MTRWAICDRHKVLCDCHRLVQAGVNNCCTLDKPSIVSASPCCVDRLHSRNKKKTIESATDERRESKKKMRVSIVLPIRLNDFCEIIMSKCLLVSGTSSCVLLLLLLFSLSVHFPFCEFLPKQKIIFSVRRNHLVDSLCVVLECNE